MLQKNKTRECIAECFFNPTAGKRIIIVFFIGIIINLFAITNVFFNHDSITLYTNNGNWLLTQGKFFVTPLVSLDGLTINIPYLCAVIGILALAISVHIICWVFDIKSLWKELLIGFCIVAFPSVATIHLYQSLDYFCLTFLGSTISAALLIKSKKPAGALVGILFLVFTIGAYQGYLGVTIGLCMLDCLKRLVRNEEWKKVILRGLKYIVEIVVSILIYYVILQLLLHITGKELSSYKGMNNAADNLKPAVLLDSIKGAYEAVFSFFFRDSFNIYKTKAISIINLQGTSISIINILLFTAFILSMILQGLKSKVFKNPWNLVWSIVLICLIPFGVNIVGVLSANQSFYYVSVFPCVLLFIMPLLISENSEKGEKEEEKNRSEKLGKWLGIVLSLLIAFCGYSWTIQNNTVYYKTYLLNKEFDAKITNLTTRIQSIDGYTESARVIFVGNPPYRFLKNAGLLDYLNQRTNTVNGYMLGDAGEIYSEGILNEYLKNALSTDLNVGSVNEVQDHSKIISEMSVYPADGSIKAIENGKYVIVKLNE